MRHILWSAGVAVFAFSVAFGQATENLTFEVASVKPAAHPLPFAGMLLISNGGPGTRDPGQITWSNVVLKQLLTTAYDVKPYQVNGPGWLDTERYDIVAKVPEGATTEQVNMMWRNLLKERFGMVVHHESKEFPVDELVVAKGGPKFKETTLDLNAPPPPPPAGPPEPPKLDKNGASETNGPGLLVTGSLGPNGPVRRMVGRAQEMLGLAMVLGDQLNRPVVDKTGLNGKYDFNLEYAGAALRPGPGLAHSDPGDNLGELETNIAAAIQQQLGLRLTPGKAKLDVVVVDKADKVPTEN
jgi:uncharacterized protein (TIGR03435 family)